MKLADWEKELAEVMPFVKEVCRKLHRHPEVGGEVALDAGISGRNAPWLRLENDTF